ncbi:MAG: response regulator [Treponema sp.]|nr:response regulator [Treponema sp.]
MKHVLLVNAPLLFREFLKDKLSAERVSIDIAQGRRDAFTKMISTLPSLIVLDISNSIRDIVDFLEKKRQDPNAALIPIIITGPVMSREQVAMLQPYNVVKYFNKPINFDVFFEAIGRLVKIAINIDKTPCILETHVNGNIIFIEIAQELNRDKLALLKYKLSEIIDENNISTPKVVIMLTNLSLTFVDGSNLEILFNNVIADTRIQKRNIKVLSLDKFTKDFIEGHTEYSGIEVTTNLSQVLHSLIENHEKIDIADLINDKILSSERHISEGTVQTRFYTESMQADAAQTFNDGFKYHIALLDDDTYTKTILMNIYGSIGAKVYFFDSGAEFIASTKKLIYDLVVLDIMMYGLSGFDILTSMHSEKYPSPFLIYSNTTNRDVIMQALNLGAKTFLIKPQQPEFILQKSLELLSRK